MIASEAGHFFKLLAEDIGAMSSARHSIIYHKSHDHILGFFLSVVDVLAGGALELDVFRLAVAGLGSIGANMTY